MGPEPHSSMNPFILIPVLHDSREVALKLLCRCSRASSCASSCTNPGPASEERSRWGCCVASCAFSARSRTRPRPCFGASCAAHIHASSCASSCTNERGLLCRILRLHTHSCTWVGSRRRCTHGKFQKDQMVKLQSGSKNTNLQVYTSRYLLHTLLHTFTCDYTNLQVYTPQTTRKGKHQEVQKAASSEAALTLKFSHKKKKENTKRSRRKRGCGSAQIKSTEKKRKGKRQEVQKEARLR